MSEVQKVKLICRGYVEMEMIQTVNDNSLLSAAVMS